MRTGPGWRDKAVAMKAADPDRSNADIGRELGVTGSAVWKALHPEKTAEMMRLDNARRGPAKREAERHARKACGRCGQMMGAGSAWRPRAPKICRECYALEEADRVHERRRTIQLMWEDGYLIREIAEVLGSTTGSVGVEMARMRRDGWDLPLRKEWSGDGLRRAQTARGVWREAA